MSNRTILTDEEIDALRAEMREQRKEIRDDLAANGVDVSMWDLPAEDVADAEAERDTADSD